ncbi:hypothetical protein [Natrinema sp. CGMCC1.2065]|uniref:hypothetical protein n=1 Tax=Natrinema sp. CGMCC1.2065 TaxID=3445767 RepID=UPI003F4A31E8
MKAIERLAAIQAKVEQRATRIGDVIGAIPGSSGAMIVTTAAAAVVGLKTYLSFLPETPRAPDEQPEVTRQVFITEFQAHGLEYLFEGLPAIFALSIGIYLAGRWYTAGQPLPTVLEDAIDRGAEWPHWWLAIPIGAVPEIVAIVPIYGYAIVRYAQGATGSQVETELIEVIESVVLPAVESNPDVALLVFTLGFWGWLAWSFLLVPLALYLDMRHVERYTYARFHVRMIIHVALVSRTFAMIRYLRRRRRAVGGWYVDDLEVDARAHCEIEGIQA